MLLRYAVRSVCMFVLFVNRLMTFHELVPMPMVWFWIRLSFDVNKKLNKQKEICFEIQSPWKLLFEYTNIINLCDELILIEKNAEVQIKTGISSWKHQFLWISCNLFEKSIKFQGLRIKHDLLLARKTSYKPFTIFRNKSFILRRFLQPKHIYFYRLFLNDNTKWIVYWAVHFLEAVHNMLIYEWNSYSVLLWKHHMNECVDKRNGIFHFTGLIVRQFMNSTKIVYIRIGLHYMLGDSLRTSSV